MDRVLGNTQEAYLNRNSRNQGTIPGESLIFHRDQTKASLAKEQRKDSAQGDPHSVAHLEARGIFI